MSDYSDEELDDVFDSSEEETYEVSIFISGLVSPRRKPPSRRMMMMMGCLSTLWLPNQLRTTLGRSSSKASLRMIYR